MRKSSLSIFSFTGMMFLMMFLFAMPLMAAEGEETKGSTTHKKYPPYPDVWDWQVPNPEAYVPGWLRTYLLDNGDVLIVYTQQKTSGAKKKKQTASKKKDTSGVDQKMANLYSKAIGSNDVSRGVESKQITLFGGLTVIDEPSNVRLMRDPDKPLKLSDGSVVKRLKSNWDKGSDILKDKTRVTSYCVHYHDCYIGPARCTLEREGIKDIIAEKVVFLLYDKPKIWEGAYYNVVDECYERDHKLKVRVESLSGSILALEDGSFLLVDNERGTIIRFNPDFTTGSPLLNKKLFVFDHDNRRDDLVLSPLFMPKINGKDYKDKHERTKMQEGLDDLYNYLMKLSKENK